MKKVLKWAAIVIGAVVVLLLLTGGVLYWIGGQKVDERFEVQTAALEIPSDSAAIAHGEYVARAQGCQDCHGEDYSGQVFADAPPFRVVASNLTAGAGGIGDDYSDEDWDRTIRHGVRPDGRPVLIMPSAAFHNLSDYDTAALIAYLKTLPPVDNELPETEVRALGRALSAFALDPHMEVRTAAARADAPPRAPTAEYGEYLANITCWYCHGEDFRGAQPPIPESPFAPDLSVTGQWPFEMFDEVLRTGVRPDGSELSEAMPIALTKHLSDDDMRALHAFFASMGGAQS